MMEPTTIDALIHLIEIRNLDFKNLPDQIQAGYTTGHIYSFLFDAIIRMGSFVNTFDTTIYSADRGLISEHRKTGPRHLAWIIKNDPLVATLFEPKSQRLRDLGFDFSSIRTRLDAFLPESRGREDEYRFELSLIEELSELSEDLKLYNRFLSILISDWMKLDKLGYDRFRLHAVTVIGLLQRGMFQESYFQAALKENADALRLNTVQKIDASAFSLTVHMALAKLARQSGTGIGFVWMSEVMKIVTGLDSDKKTVLNETVLKIRSVLDNPVFNPLDKLS